MEKAALDDDMSCLGGSTAISSISTTHGVRVHPSVVPEATPTVISVTTTVSTAALARVLLLVLEAITTMVVVSMVVIVHRPLITGWQAICLSRFSGCARRSVVVRSCAAAYVGIIHGIRIVSSVVGSNSLWVDFHSVVGRLLKGTG